ncbi:DUF6162 family protein [Moritella sp. F3]|uniref:DUF6162 family protein n=1 Tax=Moritella sp. F3 TaxID=2718882 RepID=UPI0018E169AC|nr:hypothetical protein [Moritella sp. F3]GIC77753.1 hypothetical protein FMO001_24800 [Moritella sp. F1]GIC83106.1 hypothetical protein FMO003_33860 [Moritella sp. F3]
MISQSVHPDDGGREGKWVALIIITILATAALLLPYHQTASSEQQLASHQISIKDLPTVELAMIGELRLAHEEIRNIHQDSLEFEGADAWPEMAELDELWLAPFIIDKSWERKGKHAWRKVAPALYQGIPALTTGSVAVILNSQAARPDVWLALDMPRPEPMMGNGLNASELINAGWKQVVFTGDETAGVDRAGVDNRAAAHTDKDSH